MTNTKKLIIAVAFDGTVVTHDFPKVGKDIGAVPVLKRLIEEGHRLILWTMRCDSEDTELAGKHLEAAVNWFKENEIELWGIQRNPEQDGWTKSPKCYAQLYIDDAALGAPLIIDPHFHNRAFIDWPQVELLLETEGILTRKHDIV